MKKYYEKFNNWVKNNPQTFTSLFFLLLLVLPSISFISILNREGVNAKPESVCAIVGITLALIGLSLLMANERCITKNDYYNKRRDHEESLFFKSITTVASIGCIMTVTSLITILSKEKEAFHSGHITGIVGLSIILAVPVIGFIVELISKDPCDKVSKARVNNHEIRRDRLV